jgi:adenylosuccinate lyase
VQRNARTAWDTGQRLEDLLAADPDVAGAIDRDRLSALFDPAHHLRHMDDLMERVAAL